MDHHLGAADVAEQRQEDPDSTLANSSADPLPNASLAPSVLLQSKLMPPRIGDALALLTRPWLVARIREGSEQRVISVCAPAGYGKTTLVAQAIDGSDHRVAWLSVDHRDNDLDRFVAYLLGALQRANRPTGSFAAGDLVASIGAVSGPPEALLEAALNELASSTEAITLVIDDFHRIRNPLVHHLVDYLIDFMPVQLRVVVVSRSDPPLALARVRARGELFEIRASDLSFTRQETAEFLALAGNDVFPPGLVSSVHARTEGWVVALQLLQLLIREQPAERRAAILEGFVGSRRHVAEYLLTEVLSQQGPVRRQFLLQTSILARLTGPLCDAVTEERHGQTMLHALEHDGVLLFGLDDQRRWYRYHHLLAELLVQQLTDEIGEEGVATLHGRASSWLADHDLTDDAIDHSLAARDWEHAIELIHRVRVDGREFHGTVTLRRWLEALPAPLLEADPTLAYWYGRSLSSTSQPRRAGAILDRAEQAWADAGEHHLIGEARTGRAWVAIMEGRVEDALALAASSVELNAVKSGLSYALSLETHGVALARAGRAQVALATLSRARAAHALPLIKDIEYGQTLALVGRLAEAAKHIAPGLTYKNQTDAHRRGYIWLADIYRAWNDLDRAHDYLERAEDLAFFFDAESFFPSLEIARARLLWASGKAELAHAELEEGIRRARAADVEAAARAAEAFQAGFWLAQGRLAQAEAWGAQSSFRPTMPADYVRLEEQLVYARLLLSTGSTGTALDLLARLRLTAEEDGRVVDHGRILVLEAVARQTAGDPDSACRTLTEAIVCLEPSGQIRAFADEGQAIIGLLRSIAATGAHLDYVTALLEATGHRAPPKPAATGGLIDPLSNRELEVLRLVSVGLSNREISDQLFISVPTVKRHMSTILEKLAATSRTQAVSVARSLQVI